MRRCFFFNAWSKLFTAVVIVFLRSARHLKISKTFISVGVDLCKLERIALQLFHCPGTKFICKNVSTCHHNILKELEFCSKISVSNPVRVKANNIGTDAKMISNYHPSGSISKRKKERK